MNDFLRNLRSSHKKDTSDPKRNLNGHYYPKDDRRQTLDRRSNYSENPNTLFDALQDFLPQIAENSAELLNNFKQLVHNNDLITQAQLKQMNSVSQFFDNLNTIFSNDLSFMEPSSDKKAPPSKDYIVGKNYTKNDILEIIKNMRKQGDTFAIIAKFLTDTEIPTFSGKGEWHAQTIHRLCK